MPVEHLEIIIAINPCEAGAELSPSATKYTGQAIFGHPGSVNRTSFTPLSTFSATGQARESVVRRMGVGAAGRELARGTGARFLFPGYSYGTHHTSSRRFSDTILLVRAYVWYKTNNIVFDGSVKFPRTLHHRARTGFTFWATPGLSI